MYTRQFTHLDGHNAYDLLGLDRWASRSEIEAARRRLAIRVHPDLPSGDAEWMSLINAAAAILLDEAQRESYDDYLETRAAAARAARQWAPRPATRVPRASDAGRRRWTRQVCCDNRKFIATEPRHHLVPVEHGGSAFRNPLQEGITGGMTEQIVYFLEPIQVETEHGK